MKSEKISFFDQELMGRKIKACRKYRGYTLRELAEKNIGISVSGLSLLENGKRNPTVIILHKLSYALNVSVDWLLSREWEKEFISYSDIPDELVNV